MTNKPEPTLTDLREEVRALKAELAKVRQAGGGNTMLMSKLAGILAAHDERLCLLDGKPSDLPSSPRP